VECVSSVKPKVWNKKKTAFPRGGVQKLGSNRDVREGWGGEERVLVNVEGRGNSKRTLFWGAVGVRWWFGWGGG